MSNYCTLDEVKQSMPDVTFGSTYDTLLTALITRASRMIDSYTRRGIGAYAAGTSPVVRHFDGSGARSLWVDEMAALPTLVEVDEVGNGSYTTWAANDYMVHPYNRTPYIRLDIDQIRGSRAKWPRLPRSVRITSVFGYSTDTPPDIKQAAITQVVRWFKRGQQGFADVGAVSEIGQLRYVARVDPDVVQVLDQYVYVVV